MEEPIYAQTILITTSLTSDRSWFCIGLTAEITCQQKLKALISRKTVQARDIFDLYLLLASRVEKVDLPEEIRANLNKAKEHILSMDFVVFKSQVISYLEPEDQPQFESEEVWDNIRLHLVETLSKD